MPGDNLRLLLPGVRLLPWYNTWCSHSSGTSFRGVLEWNGANMVFKKYKNGQYVCEDNADGLRGNVYMHAPSSVRARRLSQVMVQASQALIASSLACTRSQNAHSHCGAWVLVEWLLVVVDRGSVQRQSWTRYSVRCVTECRDFVILIVQATPRPVLYRAQGLQLYA